MRIAATSRVFTIIETGIITVLLPMITVARNKLPHGVDGGSTETKRAVTTVQPTETRTVRVMAKYITLMSQTNEKVLQKGRLRGVVRIKVSKNTT